VFAFRKLYDLETDLAQKHNVAAAHKDNMAELQARFGSAPFCRPRSR
jgi:hypothetical protein